MASLASRLAVRGHSVTLVTLDDGANSRHNVDAAVQVQRLNVMADSRNLIQRFRNTRIRVKRMREALRSLTPDVVLSFCDRTNILTLMASRGLSVPVVVSERSDPAQQSLGWFWERWRDRTYQRANTIIALTETSAAHLRRRFSVQVSVIPSAVDPPPFRSDRQAASGHHRIVGVGRLEPEKGFDRLIQAFDQIAAVHPEWTLRILGEGSQRSALEQQVHQLGLSHRVSLPGWVRPIWNELAAATLFALPSRYEGFPSALMEAMAMGVPCVAVDCESGPRAVIQHDTQGCLADNSVDGLAHGLRKLIRDEPLRERIGQAGMDVVDRFTWESMVDQYERVLNQAANASDAAR